jgi:HrpA-like RNA helicase
MLERVFGIDPNASEDIQESGLKSARSAAQMSGDYVQLLDLDTAREQENSLMEAYNYCGMYGFTPKVTLERISRHHHRPSSILHVELPGERISVSVRAPTDQSRLQEITAFAEFNKKAKEFFTSKNAEPTASKPLTNPLNVFNAELFVRSYVEDGDVSVSVKEEGNFCRVQIFSNKVEIGSGLSVSAERATQVAWLAAAVHMANEDPKRIVNFFDIEPSVGPSELPSEPTVDIVLNRSNYLLLQHILTIVEAADPTARREDLKSGEFLGSREGYLRPDLSLKKAEERSKYLLKLYRSYQQRPDLAALRSARANLPMSQHSSEVLDLVENDTFSIIIGATGSGKTTQVPQIILDHFIESRKGAFCNIICTQPRRIAAISVSKRVAEERGQPLQTQVGYHIRLDDKSPRYGGSITYCTTGILLQQLQHAPEYVFDNYSHLIIDEVHERDMIIDFLLTVLKKTVSERLSLGKQVPKVVLMSATMDSDLFSSYFEISDPQRGSVKCPTLMIPGRTFPVKEQFLDEILETLEKTYGREQIYGMYQEATTREYLAAESMYAKLLLEEPKAECQGEEEPIIQWKNGEVVIDWKKKKPAPLILPEADQAKSEQVPLSLVSMTVAHIAASSKGGAILVFLPGLEEMMKVRTMLEETVILGVDFRDRAKYQFFLLHSLLPDGQRDVFRPLPEGCRKIILATNIAETSITIPEVQYVVDAGKHREHTYDQVTRMSQLKSTWISKSNAKQRAGRAGRVQNGHYYALFSKDRHDSLRSVGIPELLRTDLQDTCLSIKAQAFETPIRDFLADSIEPPSSAAVDAAIDELVNLGALTKSEELTPLGRLLETLPVHPRLGKMIVMGIIYRCLDPMIILAAASGDRSLFTHPPGLKKAAESARWEFAAGSRSDHIGIINAFMHLRDVQNSDGERAMLASASNSYLRAGIFKDIAAAAAQIESILEDTGLIPRNDTARGKQYGVPQLNEFSKSEELIKALLVAGFSPHLAVRKSANFYTTAGKIGVLVHPSSVNQTVGRPKAEQQLWRIRQRLLTYTSLSHSGETSDHFIRDTTEVSPLMVALFGGEPAAPQSQTPNDDDGENDILCIDGWLNLAVPKGHTTQYPRPASILRSFRNALRDMERAILQDVGKGRILAQQDNDDKSAILARCLVRLFTSESLDAEMRGVEKELELQIREEGEGEGDGDGGRGGGGLQMQENENENEEGATMVLRKLVQEWKKKRDREEEWSL